MIESKFSDAQQRNRNMQVEIESLRKLNRQIDNERDKLKDEYDKMEVPNQILILS